MRFSSVFSLPLPLVSPAQTVERARPQETVVDARVGETPRAPELPDDLDARVRMIGEWQLGEG